MIRPARLYVTAAEVLEVVGRPADSAADLTRAEGVAELASIIVEHYVGSAGVTRHLLPLGQDEPPPSGAHEAALGIAADLWRRPSTPGCYFQVVDYVGRLAADPASSVAALLAPYRESWSIA